MSRTVHISGMYKSGTSWLLQCLAAHPEIVAWQEFDPIKASYHRTPYVPTKTRRIQAIFGIHLGGLDLVHRKQSLVPKSCDEAFADFFMGTGLVPVSGEEKRREVSNLPRDDLEYLACELFRVLGKGPRPGDGKRFKSARCERAIGIANLSIEELVELMMTVAGEPDSRRLPRLFYESVMNMCDPSAMVAFKAADQLMTLCELLDAMPETKVVLIVRDARDTVVSAAAFKRLMKAQERPWRGATTPSLAQSVDAWALRISLVAEYSKHKNVYVLRYEDLIADFDAEIAGVYEFLGVSASEDIVNRTRTLTEFKLMSGGRARGEEAASVFRKGVVGDWHAKLTGLEKALAWRIARRQLQQLGYAKDGRVGESDVIRGKPHSV